MVLRFYKFLSNLQSKNHHFYYYFGRTTITTIAIQTEIIAQHAPYVFLVRYTLHKKNSDLPRFFAQLFTIHTPQTLDFKYGQTTIFAFGREGKGVGK